MARKRREGITTPYRYKAKMYRIFGKEPPQTVIDGLVDAMLTSRNLGYGPYRTARDEAKHKLDELNVPSTLHGLYLAFVNELVSKVQQKKVASADEIIDKWTRAGLDAGILGELAETVLGLYPTTTQKAKPKA